MCTLGAYELASAAKKARAVIFASGSEVEIALEAKIALDNAGTPTRVVSVPSMELFEKQMKGPNQIERKREEVRISAKDLLAVPPGTITEQGLRTNINVGIQYLEAWLRGTGCVPLYHLMEDAATAEISRCQVWQWVKHQAKMTNGQGVTADLVKNTMRQELESIRKLIGEEAYAQGAFERASALFLDMMTRSDFPEFLTLVAYNHLD